MLKTTTQFRESPFFQEEKTESEDSVSKNHEKVVRTTLDDGRLPVNGYCTENEKPEPEGPGKGKTNQKGRERPIIAEASFGASESSTRRKKSPTLEKIKPELGGSGLRSAMSDTDVSIIAYPQEKSSLELELAETASNESTETDFECIKKESPEPKTQDSKSFAERCEPGKNREPLIPSILSHRSSKSSSNKSFTDEIDVSFESGYIRLPRSLLNDPIFRDALLEHQAIYILFINLAVYKPTAHNINGNLIELLPGQLCYSLRKLAELGGKRCTLDFVRGSIKYFQKVDFLRQHLTHNKTVITITHPDVYELIKSVGPTKGPTEVPLRSHLKEESKDSKDLRKEIAADGAQSRARPTAVVKISFSFEDREWKNIQPEDLAGWQKAYPAVNVPDEVAQMGEWLLANPTHRKSNYRAFIVRWLKNAQDRPAPVNGFRYSSQVPGLVQKIDPFQELVRRLSKSDDYTSDFSFGILEIRSSAGYVAAKFTKDQTDTFCKWLTDKNL